MRIFRVLFGFAMACLAAGLTIVLFVTTPIELASLPPEIASDAMTGAGLLALAAATHSAVFAAPFALVGVVFAEWRRISSWTYYTLLAIVIALIGFGAQYWTEAAGQASIVNNYAVTAFLATGFVAGLVYWLFSGRYAGWPPEDLPDEPEIITRTRTSPGSNGPPKAAAYRVKAVLAAR